MKKIIPIFVPHKGCPHDCIFCNQTRITGLSTDMTSQKARIIIEEALKTIKPQADVEIAFFGGSFTAIEAEYQEDLLALAKEYKDKNLVKDIRLSTRPDCIDIEKLERLKKYGVTIIELGVQSMDDEVLEQSIRGHKKDVVYKASELIKSYDFRLGLQMMLGLPADTEEKCINTAREFIKIGPSFVRIYPTLVIRETGLEVEYLSGTYKPFSLDKSVEICKKLMVLFRVNNIDIIRVGLQATDDIQDGVDVIAGPNHPAFRELVMSQMIRDYLSYVLPNKFDVICIEAANKNISTIVGNKRSNRYFINEKYKARFKVSVAKSLENSMRIIIDNQIYKEINFEQMYFELAKIYNL